MNFNTISNTYHFRNQPTYSLLNAWRLESILQKDQTSSRTTSSMTGQVTRTNKESIINTLQLQKFPHVLHQPLVCLKSQQLQVFEENIKSNFYTYTFHYLAEVLKSSDAGYVYAAAAACSTAFEFSLEQTVSIIECSALNTIATFRHQLSTQCG